jgi:hypothetical protein
VNVVVTISKLHDEMESLKTEILQSATNKSANRRARKKSVQLRNTLKEIRLELLKTEKEMG